MRTRLAVALALASTVLASGCTVPSAGTPRPASTTQAPTANPDSALPSDGAPRVKNPLDASHFERHPCDALKSEDAATLNLPPDGKQESDVRIGESCLWYNHETGGSLGATFYSKSKRGLSSLYREAHKSNWAYFEQVDDIEGHPAVASSIKEDKPQYGCVVDVGLTDQLLFSSDVALSDANVGKADPCLLAAKAAGMMMRTIREAA